MNEQTKHNLSEKAERSRTDGAPQENAKIKTPAGNQAVEELLREFDEIDKREREWDVSRPGTVLQSQAANEKRGRVALTPANQPQAPIEMVSAKDAARICGVGRTHWYDMINAGRVPQPTRLVRRVLWRVKELEQWIEFGCPSLTQWNQIKKNKSA